MGNALEALRRSTAKFEPTMADRARRHPIRPCKLLVWEEAHASAMPPQIQAHLKQCDAMPGPTTTLVVEDSNLVIAYGGINLLHQYSGEVWTVPIEEVAQRYPRELYYYAKDFITRVAAELHLKRVQVTTRAASPELDKWIARLSVGFRLDGILPKYGPDGEDYKMWSVTWG